uniref:Uncharacterized protein n=1 Tax=Chrysemys picta bellii TaxID=8478 RepID=A0A8C3F6H8_CHRPI
MNIYTEKEVDSLAPVIPAIWEAEAGRSLELRGSGLQCAMPIGCLVPLTAWPAGG